jgi:hypothetical protein
LARCLLCRLPQAMAPIGGPIRSTVPEATPPAPARFREALRRSASSEGASAGAHFGES